MNDKKNERVRCIAEKAGFTDVRELAHGNGTLFFLFRAYRPAPPAEYGKINISNYYLSSQYGYRGMKKIVAQLNEEGIYAEEFREHGVKRLALETGGFIGLNSLYYHEQYGSFVSIHVLKTDIKSDAGTPKKRATCRMCLNCVRACHTGAISERGLRVERCLRAHSNERSIPKEFRASIYQLLGCERCQSACPCNDPQTGEAHAYDLIEVIEGKHTEEIRALVGTNYGRRRIILGQAVIYAANVRYTPALAAIEALREDEFVGEAARFAMEILKKS
ncbi:MAG: hypothetical protein RR597_06510 [Christensenella sp.]